MARRYEEKVISWQDDGDVGLASDLVANGIAGLISLLGDDRSDQVETAREVPSALGARAVFGPLAATLVESDSVAERLGCVRGLADLAGEVLLQVVRALIAALRVERDPDVVYEIKDAIEAIIHKDLEADEPEDATIDETD